MFIRVKRNPQREGLIYESRPEHNYFNQKITGVKCITIVFHCLGIQNELALMVDQWNKENPYKTSLGRRLIKCKLQIVGVSYPYNFFLRHSACQLQGRRSMRKIQSTLFVSHKGRKTELDDIWKSVLQDK